MLILTYHLYEYFRVSGQQAMNVLGIHLSSNVIYFIFRKLQETQMSTSSKLEESEHRVQVLQAGLTTLWILVGWEIIYFCGNLYGSEKN